MTIKRKTLSAKREASEPHLGPRAKKLHRSIDHERLQDAVILNETETGFKLDAEAGDRLIVTRSLDGAPFTSVCIIISVGSGPDGVVELFDETRLQHFGFTPNDAAIHYSSIQIKLLGESRIVSA